jgi:DNA-binding IclR family transcriptional regulator
MRRGARREPQTVRAVLATLAAAGLIAYDGSSGAIT